MGLRTKDKLVGMAPLLLLLAILIGFPLYSLCSEGSIKPGHEIIQKVALSQCQNEADCKDHINALNIEELSSFYDTVITVLLAVLAVVAGLAVWSLRLISHAAAEDIAREAVRGIIKDSREFHDKITNAIKDEVQDRFSSIQERLDQIEKALGLRASSAQEAAAESTEENQVIPPQDQGV